MTAVQQQIIEQVHNLMREHFDSSLIVAETDDAFTVDWNGTIVSAMGLCEFSRQHLNLKVKHDSEQP